MNRRKVMNSLIFLLLAIFSIVTLFPIIWTAITSLKTDVQMFAIPPDLLPHPATLSHYKEVLMGNFPAYIRNSMLVTFFSCAISLALGIPAAYGFAKYATEAKTGLCSCDCSQDGSAGCHGNSFFPDHP